MAAFTDQFTRHPPLRLPAGGLFGDRLWIAVGSACEVLEGRSAADVSRIAGSVSELIDAAAREYGQAHTEHEAEELAEEYPFLSPASIALVQSENALELAEAIRDELGELGLFLTLEAHRTRHEGAPGAISFERSDALATLCLWLAADCIDEVAQEPHAGADDGEPPRYGADSAALAMDAMRASMLAIEARQRELDRASLDAEGVRAGVAAEMEARAEAIREELSKRGLDAAEVRWGPKRLLAKRAVELAHEGGYESYAEAARQIQYQVPQADGVTVYNLDTIERWLKKGGWRPPEKG